MKKEDNEFQKICQLWRKEVKDCLKGSDDKKADHLCVKIAESLKAWEDQQKTTRMRVQMLRALLAAIELEKGIIKRARKKQNRRDSAND